MDYPATGANADKPVPTTQQLNRGHTSVSYLVSKKDRNREPMQTLDFLVGLLVKDQHAYFFFVHTHTSSSTPWSFR